jgi:hypothetical protein
MRFHLVFTVSKYGLKVAVVSKLISEKQDFSLFWRVFEKKQE